MASSPETIRIIDEQIIRSDVTICRHIESLDAAGRDAVSQDILQNMRTFAKNLSNTQYHRDYEFFALEWDIFQFVIHADPPEYGVARGGRSPIALKSNFKTRSTSIEDQQGSRRS